MPETPRMKPDGSGLYLPSEVDYVWRRGEGPDKAPSPYATKRNGISVKRVSDYGDAFDQGLAFALAYETMGDVEGGKPHEVEGDRGGFTKYGIAQNRNPDVDVPNLTLDTAIAHYRTKYWPEAEKLPDSAPNLQALFFEGFMNMERGATKSLQRAIGTPADGSIGPKTLHALEKALDDRGEDAVIREYLWQRSEYYKSIWRNDPTQEKFKDGWQNRIDDVGYYAEDVLNTLA
jgi:lysozyme family protein